MAGGHRFPEPSDLDVMLKMADMGQKLVDPPSVEGWHTGTEWITTGSLVDRVNFAVDQLADEGNPLVSSIAQRIGDKGGTVSPDSFVDSCLDLVGPIVVTDNTRQGLLAHAAQVGDVEFGSERAALASRERVREMLQLIVSTKEYQLA